MEEKRERVRIGGRKSNQRTWSLHTTTRVFSSIAWDIAPCPHNGGHSLFLWPLVGHFCISKPVPAAPWTIRELPTTTGLASPLSLIPPGIYIKAQSVARRSLHLSLTMRDGSLADGGFPLGLCTQSATSNNVCCSCFMSDKSPKTRSWLHIALTHIHRQSCDWSLRNKALMNPLYLLHKAS